MPNTVDNAFVRTFENNVRFLAQQSDTRLRKYVDEVNGTGEDHVWDTLGVLEAEEKTKSGIVLPDNAKEKPQQVY